MIAATALTEDSIATTDNDEINTPVALKKPNHEKKAGDKNFANSAFAMTLGAKHHRRPTEEDFDYKEDGMVI